MSLRDRPVAARIPRWRTALAAVVGLGGAVVLGACAPGEGLRPLYGASGTGVAVPERMTQVDIPTIPGRVGQRIRNELVFQTVGTHSERPTAPSERLEIVIKESLLSSLVTTTGNSLSQIYQIEASYRLIDLSTKKVVTEGKSLGRAAFERNDSVYSNVRGREDAENRVARTVADDIKIRLAAYFSRGI